MASKAQAHRAIAVLLAAYPAANRDEDVAEQFARILVHTLDPYPPEVLGEMVNPRTGIIATSKFMPSIAEIKIWCDRCWDRLAPRSIADASPAAGLIAGPSAERIAEITAEQRAANVARFHDLLRELRATSAEQDLSRSRRPSAGPETGSTGPS